MDIAPYELTEASDTGLKIALTASQNKKNRVYHLWLPLMVLFCCTFFLFFLNKKTVPGWLKWIPFLATVASLFLLFIKYTMAITFTRAKILVTKRWSFFRSGTIFKVEELDSIGVNNTTGTTSIYVTSKKNKKKTLLIFFGDESEAISITELISAKTGLQILPTKAQSNTKAK